MHLPNLKSKTRIHMTSPEPSAAYAHLKTPRVSVVVPCFNEQEVFAETHRRLEAVLQQNYSGEYEIIYVNDGSKDATLSLMRAVALASPAVVAVDLSRNFGHQLALSAGLTLARGARILMIDADLQDPPELLVAMMQQIDAGADVVYGQRTERQGETWFKKASAGAFYRVLDRMTDVDIPLDTGDFRLVTRQVLDELLKLPEQQRFIRGMFAWLGFNQVPLPYKREARFAGETKYPLRRMVRFAMDAIAGFSAAPLRIAMIFAGLAMLLALAVGAYVLISLVFFDTVRGWASLLLVVSGFSAVQLFCLGIIGDYLARIYTQAKARPLFIIREVIQNAGARTSTPADVSHESPNV
jgi:polyisoprenyl-phosphate glycosyltransferase